ncbi:MAG: hypothetical protein WKG01_14690 [Kofleriaceae bacterium]
MSHHDDELPTLDHATLDQVTGGAGTDSSMPLLMMMRGRQSAAAPPPPATLVLPKILVDGVEQSAASGAPTTV